MSRQTKGEKLIATGLVGLDDIILLPNGKPANGEAVHAN